MTIDVIVAPRASRERLGPVAEDGRLRLAVTAPPVDDEANAAVIALVARALRLPRRQVTILHGKTSRRKTLRIEGATAGDIERLLA